MKVNQQAQLKFYNNVQNGQGGTVILLDELKNGLGVNCLDEITDYICEKSYDSNTQFILTSHHPYRKMRRKAPSFSYGDERRKKILAF
ncbi:MAG: ATP-binding protein [Selenomonadaceae bacterium]|nr:ATP-binding protein [Selenomonadaceae bacterium]